MSFWVRADGVEYFSSQRMQTFTDKMFSDNILLWYAVSFGPFVPLGNLKEKNK